MTTAEERPPRERRVIEAFAELADSLVRGYDVDDFLHRLIERSVDLMAADAGGVLLHHGGQLRVAAASSEDMATLELFELQNEEGPCFDAFSTGEPMVIHRLADHEDQWPKFVPQAADLGWVSAHAVPMRLRDERIGAMNLFATSERSFGEQDVRLAQGLADVATVAIIHERMISDREATVRQLQAALDSRVVIEQAKGRIAEGAGLDMHRAFELIRGHARSHNLKLREVSQRVVDGDLGVADLE